MFWKNATNLKENTHAEVASQLYWNRTSASVFSGKFAAYFQNTLSEDHLWKKSVKHVSVMSLIHWMVSCSMFLVCTIALIFLHLPLRTNKTFQKDVKRSFKTSQRNGTIGWSVVFQKAKPNFLIYGFQILIIMVGFQITMNQMQGVPNVNMLMCQTWVKRYKEATKK